MVSMVRSNYPCRSLTSKIHTFPCEESYFGFLTYYSSSPVVVLDHNSLVTPQYTAEGYLEVEFSSPEAFAKASRIVVCGQRTHSRR